MKWQDAIGLTTLLHLGEERDSAWDAISSCFIPPARKTPPASSPTLIDCSRIPTKPMNFWLCRPLIRAKSATLGSYGESPPATAANLVIVAGTAMTSATLRTSPRVCFRADCWRSDLHVEPMAWRHFPAHNSTMTSRLIGRLPTRGGIHQSSLTEPRLNPAGGRRLRLKPLVPTENGGPVGHHRQLRTGFCDPLR